MSEQTSNATVTWADLVASVHSDQDDSIIEVWGPDGALYRITSVDHDEAERDVVALVTGQDEEEIERGFTPSVVFSLEEVRRPRLY